MGEHVLEDRRPDALASILLVGEHVEVTLVRSRLEHQGPPYNLASIRYVEHVASLWISNAPL